MWIVERGDLSYGIPPANPFVAKPGWREEIWALGLGALGGFIGISSKGFCSVLMSGSIYGRRLT